jgi:hypothetical protein
MSSRFLASLTEWPSASRWEPGILRVFGSAVFCLALVLGLSLVGVPDAQASTRPADRAARLMSRAAPDGGNVSQVQRRGDDLTAAGGSTQVAIPVDPADAISFEASDSANRVQVSLPAEVDVEEAAVAAGGTVVYRGLFTAPIQPAGPLPELR